MVSTGEQVTVALLSMALIKRGVPAVSYTGNQVRILTDSTHQGAHPAHRRHHIRAGLKAGRVVVVAGLWASTAAATSPRWAAAVPMPPGGPGGGVEGRRMPDLHRRRRRLHHRSARSAAGRRLDKITFEEMLEMASLGSRCCRSGRSSSPASTQRPLRVLHSFQEGPGTLITIDDEEESMEQPIISGIAFNRDEAKLTIRGVPDTSRRGLQILGRSVPPMWKST
ncbi:hypothetical protein P4133_10165 [Pseudomonas aeruginosa]|nr:hypothetical protein [Pseudomonas aeruginosa]